jgi:hypothetical protein
MTDNEILECLGTSLVKSRMEQIASLDIPEEVKLFLESVGLPYEFGIESASWGVVPTDKPFAQIKFGGLSYTLLWLGEVGLQVCLDPTGKVVAVGGSEPKPTFINSTLRSCVSFICLQRRIRGDDDETIRSLIRTIKDGMLAEDPSAFSDEENWWSIVFWEYENVM